MSFGEAQVRAVVVDDEPTSRDVVRTLLAEHPRIVLVGEAGNGRGAVELVRRTRPDLLFLDIQMPDADGFSVLSELGAEVPRGVVFVTAHDEHAVRAFEVYALDYLLKPFGRPRFAAAVARALERLNALDALTLQRTVASMTADRAGGSVPEGLATLDPPVTPERRPVRRIGVRTGSKVVLVEVERIDWLEALGDYARIHAGSQTHLVGQSLQSLESVLDPGEFVRIHRGSIVRLTRIRELLRETDGSGAVVLESGVRLRVARG
ncbi:MAG: LytR/AlgR family response regulator transcription factor, partial [Gemmatimonadales bacterium]